MIPRTHIVAWRAEAPWSLDSQVEQDPNLEAKVADPAFGRDLRPLLAPGVVFDATAAAGRVRNELISRIR